MGTIVFVEIMDRQQQVKQRILVKQFPVTIGRAYSNDIIVDDPYIRPTHARIELDNEGEIVIVDTESKNGIQSSGKTKEAFRVSDRKGLKVTLGNTPIRLRTPEFILEPTRTRYSKTTKLQDIIDNKRYIPLLFLLPLSYLLLRIYLLSTENFFDSGPELFFPICLSIVIWCTGWALLNRILSVKFNFLFHLILVCSAAFVLDITFISISYLSFLLQLDTFFKILTGSIVVLLESLLLFGHLSILGNIRLRNRLLFSGGSLILILTFFLIVFFENQREFSPHISFNNELKPLPESLIPVMSHQVFFNKTEDLIHKLKLVSTSFQQSEQ